MNRNRIHDNNLLVSHKQTMLVGIGGLVLMALMVVSSIVWSFAHYRQTTQNTYVFHRKGAAIAIYDDRTKPSVTQLNSRSLSARKR